MKCLKLFMRIFIPCKGLAPVETSGRKIDTSLLHTSFLAQSRLARDLLVGY